MNNVLTLVTDSPIGHSSVLERVRSALRSRGAAVGEPRIDATGRAADLPFGGLAPAIAERETREALDGAPIDLLAQATVDRPKRLLVADLESTIIANEMLDDMAAATGVGDAVATITRRAMRGELDFAEALAARLRLFEGQPVALLDTVAKDIRLNPGAESLLAGARGAGIRTAIVTGGFHVFADAIGRRLGVDQVFANRLGIDGGRLTGLAVPPILGRDAKREHLLALCRQHGFEPAQAVAIGDGANDLAMLAAAGLGVAYHAKPAVREVARARIDHTGLDTLLFLLGIAGGEGSM